jgi:hypothetical protein
MQSEQFDKKVQRAAGQHHPAYNEQAWDKMKKLLDKHLPEKEDGRRRIFFFLLLFLLLGGGATWLFISKPWQEKKTFVAEQNQFPLQSRNDQPVKKDNKNIIYDKPVTNVPGPPAKTGDNAPGSPGSVTNDKTTTLVNEEVKKDDRDRESEHPSVRGRIKTKDQPGSHRLSVQRAGKIADKRQDREKPLSGDKISSNPLTNVTARPQGNIVSQQNNKDHPSAIGNVLPPTVQKNPADTKDLSSPADLKAEPTVTKVDEKPADAPSAKNKKVKNKNKSPFFFSLSTGPDISAAGSSRLGRIKLLAGAGLGYTFKNRITVRTGFYTSRKIYTASPDEYHPAPGSWGNYPYMQKIDADCHVFEIPVSVSYNFHPSAKQQWFVSTGLSSYLMKKEVYDYYYKYSPTSPVYRHSATIRNGDRHYFSVLNLSAGYQRSLGKTVSILAEPYMKLPLTGVGFGNVKLNSGGVLLTLSIRPFAVKGKKN